MNGTRGPKRKEVDMVKVKEFLMDGVRVKDIASILNVTIDVLRVRLRESGVITKRYGSQANGLSGERYVKQALKSFGISARSMPYSCDFDLLVEDKYKIEVKTAGMQVVTGVPVWRFNIHRHAKLVENCDYYILRLEKVPYFKSAVHLLVPSPIGRKTMSISFRGLLNGHWGHAMDFNDFLKGSLALKKRRAAVRKAKRKRG